MKIKKPTRAGSSTWCQATLGHTGPWGAVSAAVLTLLALGRAFPSFPHVDTSPYGATPTPLSVLACSPWTLPPVL